MKTIRMPFAVKLVPAAFLFASVVAAFAQSDAGKPETVWFEKQWDLQFCNLEEAIEVAARNNALAPEDWDSASDSGLTLDEKPEKKADSGMPPLVFPKEGDGYWGWFNFRHPWWINSMTQPDARGTSFEVPSKGVTKPPHKYHNVWLRKFREVPAQWKGRQIWYRLQGITGCDVLLFVNKKLAGTIYRTEGELNISDLLEYGKRNEFLMLLSANGFHIPPVKKSTYTGLRKGGKYNPNGGGGFDLKDAAPQLAIYPEIYFTDVFANTSWRKKTLTVETEFISSKTGTADFTAEVVDADGKVVKKTAEKIKVVKGVNALKPVIPWADPITWEFGRGYMYKMRAALAFNGKRVEYPEFRFGFREIWREERKIFMNGHDQRFRVVYNFGANTNGVDFLHDIGYNVIQNAHKKDLNPSLDVNMLYYLAEKGMGVIDSAPIISWGMRGPLWNDPDIAEDFEKHAEKNLRKYRNIPSIVACYFGVNLNVPRWTQEAIHLGSNQPDSWVDKLLTRTSTMMKKYNPNVLFYSHADGINSDIASDNLYLNFIPLQEREEWPSRWSQRGHYPYQAAEFGQPYYHCWSKGGRGLMSEYLAIYFGEEAYQKEPFTIQCRNTPPLYIRRLQHPMYWEFIRKFVWRTNRAWRTYGVNAGWVYFNLEEGFGMPGWTLEGLYNKYGPSYNLPEKIKGRPDWAFPSYDIYQQANKDFVGYIGGFPKHTDKTHAYFSGEDIVKQSVTLWDHFVPKVFSVEWSAKLDDGSPLGAGKFSNKLEPGTTAFDEIRFKAPDVAKKTAGKIEAVFKDDSGKTVFKDSVAFEVYPKKAPAASAAAGRKIALLDPSGLSEPLLKSLGISGYTKVASFEETRGFDRIIVGRFGLATGKDNIEKNQQGSQSNQLTAASWSTVPFIADPAVVAAGAKIMILSQRDTVWRDMGFEVMDPMARKLYLRDTSNPLYDAVTQDTLEDWRGAPTYLNGNVWDGSQFGHQVGFGDHGSRWTYNMAVAGIMVKSPDVVGFIPQIDGEFDMNYSANLKYKYGKGSVNFCSLDMEDRAGSDPAAMTVAKAVFDDFLADEKVVNTRKIYWSGNEASNILSNVRVSGTPMPKNIPSNAADSLILVGADSSMPFTDVVASAKNGANVLVVCNKSLVKAAGFKVEEKKTFINDFNRKNPVLCGLGQAHFRWRDYMYYDCMKTGSKNARIDADGMIAVVNAGKGVIVFSQMDPFQIERRHTPIPAADVKNTKAQAAVDKAVLDDDMDRVLNGDLSLPDAKAPIPTESIAKNLYYVAYDYNGTANTYRGYGLPEKATNRNIFASAPVKLEKSDLDNMNNNRIRADITIEHGYQFYSRILTNLGAMPSEDSAKRIFLKDRKPGLYNGLKAGLDPYQFTYW